MNKTNIYGNKKTQTLNDDQNSITFWLAMIIVMVFLIWAPFQRGLFNGYSSDFDTPIYTSFVWSSIILLLVAISLLYNWKLKTTGEFLSIFIWILPMCYLLSTTQAASYNFSLNMLYVHIMYAVFFIFGIYWATNKIGANLIQSTIICSGYIIVIFGLLNWFGNASYKDAVMLDYNQLRLTSVFQYANTYAAFLIAILFSCLLMIIRSKQWYITVFHSLMLIPIILSFFLTLSRGGIVVLPIVFLAILFFLPVAKQITSIIHLSLASIGTLIILNKVNKIGIDLDKQFSASLSWKGWLIVAVASLVVAGIAWLIQHFLLEILQNRISKISKLRYVQMLLPMSAILLGLSCIYLIFGNSSFIKLFPESISQRIENINFKQHSVLERETFFTDSVKLFKDYPILGSGGGAWAALYEKYQNNPYTSRQTHNFLLQYLVETGLIGISVLIIILILVFYNFIKSYIRNSQEVREQSLFFFIISFSLLLHSIIDFNLSYGYVGALVFLCMGAMAATSREPVKLLTKMKSNNLVNKIYPATTLVISIVFFIVSIQLLTGNRLYHSAIAAAQNNQPFNDIVNTINSAIDRNPHHPDYYILKSDLFGQAYQQTKDEKYYSELVSTIQSIKKVEPNNRNVMESEYKISLLKSNFSEARSVLLGGIENYPWEISIYERLISIDLELGNKAREIKNSQDMDLYWNHAIELYNVILSKSKSLESLPPEQYQGRPFNVTGNIAFAIGQIYFIRGDFNTSSSILKIGVTDQLDDQQTRLNIRWYLASLQRQQKNDQELYNKLIAKDANEANEIQKLVTANLSTQ